MFPLIFSLTELIKASGFLTGFLLQKCIILRYTTIFSPILCMWKYLLKFKYTSSFLDFHRITFLPAFPRSEFLPLFSSISTSSFTHLVCIASCISLLLRRFLLSIRSLLLGSARMSEELPLSVQIEQFLELIKDKKAKLQRFHADLKTYEHNRHDKEVQKRIKAYRVSSCPTW